MSIETLTNRTRQSGDGANQDFDFSFPAANEDELRVYFVDNDTDEATLKTITTHYTVALNSDGTGTVTTVGVLTVDQDILILRVVPLTQPVEYPRGGKLDTATLEASLDRLTKIAQQQQEALDRAFTVGVAEEVDDDTLAGALLTVQGYVATVQQSADDAAASEAAAVASAVTAAASETAAAASAVTAAATLATDYKSGAHIGRDDDTHIYVTKGKIMINGSIRTNTSALSLTFSVPSDGDFLDVWAGADAPGTTFTATVVGSGATPGGTSNPYTNGRLIGSIKYNTTGKITEWIQYDQALVWGWTQVVGNGSATLTKTVAFGVTFDYAPVCKTNSLGRVVTTIAGAPSAFVSNIQGAFGVAGRSTTTTGFTIDMETESGSTWSASYYHGLWFEARGTYS